MARNTANVLTCNSAWNGPLSSQFLRLQSLFLHVRAFFGGRYCGDILIAFTISASSVTSSCLYNTLLMHVCTCTHTRNMGMHRAFVYFCKSTAQHTVAVFDGQQIIILQIGKFFRPKCLQQCYFEILTKICYFIVLVRGGRLLAQTL